MLPVVKCRILLTWFIAMTFSYCAGAVEVYSFLDDKCKLTQGLIIDSSETAVSMMTLSGYSKSVDRAKIKFSLIHNTLENPISKIRPDHQLQSQFYDIYISGHKKPLFTGWAVRFIENLVIFFDIQGNTHALELYDISKIRPASLLEKDQKLKAKKLEFHLGSMGQQCGIKNSLSAVRPTRILADQVQINELLDNFDKGFINLQSYKERTYLYAKPYLYERKTRMGIVIAGDTKETTSTGMPFYFQWANGESYRFQSFNQFGGLNVEYLPSAEPTYAFRSDLKSHVFHASFVGNLMALAAGTEFFTPQQSEWAKILDKDKRTFSRSAPSFNYMALMGGDWGPYSLSFGTYFANQMIYIKDSTKGIDDFREILASNISPIFRVMYTSKKLKLVSLVSQTKSDSDNVNDLDLSVDPDTSVIGIIERYSFESLFLRFNGDYQINDDFSVGASQIIYDYKYSENQIGNLKNFMDGQHLTSQVHLKHAFGDYVAIKLHMNYQIIKKDFSFSGLAKSEEDSGTSFGGSFEFVF